MKKLLFLLATLFYGCHLFACTTFFIDKNGQMVFGRNYDWVTGNGMVCTNQRGLAKTSMKTSDGGTASWVSKYGSITFNQYGKEFPTGGMNEKGLVIELMWLDGTVYPAPDERPAVGVLQWIQYHLDNCSSVNELVAENKNIRIASKGTTPLHYLVADATGNAAVIEFLDGKMIVHTGKDLPFPVLANDRYEQAIRITQKQMDASANTRVFTGQSTDRFSKACSMVNKYQQMKEPGSPIDHSFAILDAVAQGDHTKWSIVYDISNKKIYFKTLGYAQVKEVSFDRFDFACDKPSQSWDMNQPVSGDISALFKPFTLEKKLRADQPIVYGKQGAD